MKQRYFQPDQWLSAAQNALKLRMLITVALSVLFAVVVYGVFRVDSDFGFWSILSHFAGGAGVLLSLLFGLTALAHQLHCQITGESVPSCIEACRFAWGKSQSILMLPAWGAGVLFALILAELLIFSLANIPALGLIWLSLIGIPLLLLNTVVAVALMVALFNIAARMAITDSDSTSLKNDLWQLLKEKLPELLIYNLGGILVALFMVLLVLSPLWLGAQMTLSLVDYAAQEPLMRIYDATGFWGSIAHLIGLIMLGLLLAAVASVPAVVITHLTLLIHLELIGENAVPDEEPVKARRSSQKKKTPTQKQASSDKEHDK